MHAPLPSSSYRRCVVHCCLMEMPLPLAYGGGCRGIASARITRPGAKTKFATKFEEGNLSKGWWPTRLEGGEANNRCNERKDGDNGSGGIESRMSVWIEEIEVIKSHINLTT